MKKNSNQNVIPQIRIETFQVLEWKCESPQNGVANQNSEISLLELLSQLLNEFSKLA